MRKMILLTIVGMMAWYVLLSSLAGERGKSKTAVQWSVSRDTKGK